MSNQVLPLSVPSPAPYISVVIPVFNEEDNLSELGDRLMRTLSAMDRAFEIIFVDDGSTDRSWQLLSGLNRQHPQNIRALQFHRNFGQHQAIFAGFQAARGQVMVTLDADLQNPPEEIPRLVAKLEEGYDTVGGWRENRRDSVFRKFPSMLVNYVMSRVTGVKLRDYGCMLRAYRREVIDSINQCHESSSFIPALANLFSQKVAEIPVGHAERERGQSKYGLFKLLRLNFDLMTGFSNLPIHLVGFMGVAIALLGLFFGLFLFIRRIFVGPEVGGLFTLFAILFVFVGLNTLGLALIGEYVGRIYREVRQRPRYVIRQTLGPDS
ncbi:MAG: glycosyltransferase [Syntrophobacterales bacterium]|jgi:undecaprenyl-phosphate 4-deoxy-4-formamido-L-arabinose transferase|nr:glycosyltransferase [Syntrophobacterales bacterium]